MDRREFLRLLVGAAGAAAVGTVGLGAASTLGVAATAEPAFASRITRLQFRATGGGSWSTRSGIARLVPDTDRVVHTVEITGLTADRQYEFQLPGGEVVATYLTCGAPAHTTTTVHWQTLQPHPDENYSQPFAPDTRRFRTLPATLPPNESLRVAQVSDTHGRAGNSGHFARAAERGARLFIHSGDMATGDGGSGSISTWHILCDALTAGAVNGDGEMIPVLAAIGNHEVLNGAGGVEWSTQDAGNKPDFNNHVRGDAEWYYSFFPSYPGLRGFALVDVGDYLTVWTLDPGISTRVDDERDSQIGWLASTLAARPSVPHRLVSTHYSPWPIGRRMMVPYYRVGARRLGRVMQAGGVRLCLVGHEHVLGRTVAVNDWGELDHQDVKSESPDGVVFIGSGPASGTGGPRTGRNPSTKWWIHSSRASEWQYFDFEQESFTRSSPGYEPREGHASDGTAFPDAEVNHLWEIDMRTTSRTVRAIDGNGDVWGEFTQDADPDTSLI